jgi:hypothetical protein
VDRRAAAADESRFAAALAVFEAGYPATFAIWDTVRAGEVTETVLARQLGMPRAWVTARLVAGDAFLSYLADRL